jgi:hypothetical protein
MIYGYDPLSEFLNVRSKTDPFDSGQRFSDQKASGSYGRLGENLFVDQDKGGTFRDPYIDSLMYGNPNLIEDYFSTGRFDNFNPRVGIVAAPQIQNTNVSSDDDDDDDYENIERFAEEPDYRNIFQKGYDAYMDQSGTSRGIMNLILSGGNPFAAAAGFFAPQIASSVVSGLDYLFGNRLDERQLAQNIQSAESDSPDSSGISSFDAAVSAGIQAAEDDI